MEIRDTVSIAKDKIAKAKCITLISGSGISAESGIPTFRGTDGLWKTYRAEDLATPRAFYSNPELVWEWYNWRRDIIRSKKPNNAHYFCSDMEKKRGENFFIITQNIDGLHQMAGSQNVLEIHGSIWKTKCIRCEDIRENRDKLSNLPKCSICGSLLRPYVVWFGEALDEDIILKSFNVLFNSDVVIVVGTSGVVYPAAQFASSAKENGSYLIEINIDETPNSDIVDLSIRGKAGEILPQFI